MAWALRGLGWLKVQPHELVDGHCLRWLQPHGEGRHKQWLIQVSEDKQMGMFLASRQRQNRLLEHFFLKSSAVSSTCILRTRGQRCQDWARLLNATAPHVHPVPAFLLGTAPQLEALAPLPSAGHNGHPGLLPSLGSAVRHQGSPS